MKIRSVEDFQMQCKLILNWKNEHLYPVELFGLSVPYNTADIEKAYRKMALRFHPDKNNGEQQAENAFAVINDAKNYLLYTINKHTMDVSENPFYLVLEKSKTSPLTVGESAFFELLTELEEKIDYSQKQRYVRDEVLIEKIKSAILANKDLLKLETIFFRTVTYLAAQLNDVELFTWLLENGADPLFRMLFGMSAVDIACVNKNYQIIDRLKEKMGEVGFTNMIDEMFLTSTDPRVLEQIIIYLDDKGTPKSRESILAASEENNFLISVLAKLSYITKEQERKLVRERIIGNPALYTAISSDLQSEQFLIVAALAQSQEYSITTAIPYAILEPHFLGAILSLWPSLQRIENVAPWQYRYSRQGSLVAQTCGNFLLATGLTVAILSPALLIPGAAAIFGICLAALVCCELISLYHALKIDQEKGKIHQLIEQNGFFKPSHSDVDGDVAAASYQTELESVVRYA